MNINIQQIWFSNVGKCRYNLAEEFFFPPIPRPMATACKHPKVRIVSRHDDTEYVECQDCGEVFDSEEFRDMEIEETAEPEPSLEDS
jgi:aminopeptidase-like protein